MNETFHARFGFCLSASFSSTENASAMYIFGLSRPIYMHDFVYV